MDNIHFDKCFLNGNVMMFEDLPEECKPGAENRYSFTDLATLNICPRKYYEETWEDTGMANSDSSAHGIVGHYLQGVFLAHCYGQDMCIQGFRKEAMQLAKDVLTYDKTKARTKIDKTYAIMNYGFLRRLYVTRMFDVEKYLAKIAGFIDNLTEIYWVVRPGTFKNLFVETGVYLVKDGNVIFGKVDLLIEHFDGTYTVIDHKSSFNTMFFQRMQLPVYGVLLGQRIRSLVVNEMCSGNAYHYPKSSLTESMLEATDFMISGLDNIVNEDEEPKFIVSQECKNCTVVNCVERQVDESGYVTI